MQNRIRTNMPDLPMKPQRPATPAPLRAAKPAVKPSPAKRVVKPQPPVEQPRDRFGRFARKTGQVLWGAAKGTVKAAGKAHRTVKRVNASARRYKRLELREREVALRERQAKLGKRRRTK
jgi:hypothetical protein